MAALALESIEISKIFRISLSTALKLLIMKDSQELCREEIRTVIGDTRPEVSHMPSLPYTLVKLLLKIGQQNILRSTRYAILVLFYIFLFLVLFIFQGQLVTPFCII